MPNVKEGSVVEFKYRVISPYITNVDEFALQEDIPINRLEATFYAPEYYNFKLNVKGFLRATPTVSQKNKNITMRIRSTEQGRAISNVSTEKVDFMENRYLYDLNNVPALKEEPYVNNIDNYRSAVKYELSYTKFPNSPILALLGTFDIIDEDKLRSSGYSEKVVKPNMQKKMVEMFPEYELG